MKRARIENLRGFYAIVDPSCCAKRDPLEVARSILAGGCAAVQLRAKNLPDQALLELGKALAVICRDANVPVFINDRPDIALAVGADGVHLGQGDMPMQQARQMLGEMAIGISTHTPAQAQTAIEQGADLIGYGPVFATSTKKTTDRTVGIDGLASVCGWASVPVVAIGGITLDNVGAVSNAGVPLVAAISAVCGAENPLNAARAMHLAVLSSASSKAADRFR